MVSFVLLYSLITKIYGLVKKSSLYLHFEFFVLKESFNDIPPPPRYLGAALKGLILTTSSPLSIFIISDLCLNTTSSDIYKGFFDWPSIPVDTVVYVLCPHSTPDNIVYATKECSAEKQSWNNKTKVEWEYANIYMCPDPPFTQLMQYINNTLSLVSNVFKVCKKNNSIELF